MSCYIAYDETVNRIVTGLRDAAHATSGPLIHLDVPFNFTGDSGNQRDQGAQLAQRLRDMNEAAVRSRYRDADTTGMIHGGQQLFAWLGCPNPWQLLRSLDCYLYQCAEDTIPQTSELYQQLDQIRVDLAGVLARDTDHYKKCEWA